MMRCHLWDLVDEGIDEVLDRLKGEAGITGISVPLVCPPVEQLRPHKGVSPRTFRSRGGVQFQPHSEFYANTRLRPVVAEWLRKSNPLPQVAEACAKRGLTLRGEINCCESPVMVEKYPFAAVKDVFGEVKPHRLCPVNRDVKQYLLALAANVRHKYGIQLIQVHGLDGNVFRPVSDRAEDARPNDPSFNASVIVQYLLDVCFCESCRQHAEDRGSGAAGVAREVQRGLEQLFVSWEAAEDLAGFISKLKGLDAYLEAQIRATADFSRSLGSGAGANERRIGLSLPVVLDSATVVRLVSSFVSDGAQTVTFGNYGDTPLSCLAWIKQAVRKAQRDIA